MSETLIGLRHQIDGAEKLDAVVRSMKALAASRVSQFERAVLAIGDYYHTVELGLWATLHHEYVLIEDVDQQTLPVSAVVFGSDQGMVGQFNGQLAEFVQSTLAQRKEASAPPRIWVVGERMQTRFEQLGQASQRLFPTPNSVAAIVPLIGQILSEIEIQREMEPAFQLLLFHNQPLSDATYRPVCQRILPLDRQWYESISRITWPTHRIPVLLNSYGDTISSLINEYLFVSLFKACAESLASENATRLAVMRRADKNIEELLGTLNQSFHRLRQASIDAELFDLIAGFESLPSTQ